jgi:GntR family transcriptional regulator
MRALTYREIADDLHHRIQTGEYPPGSALPQNPDLGQSYGVSVSTAQRAVMLLRDRELVLGVPGRGVFVREPRLGR